MRNAIRSSLTLAAIVGALGVGVAHAQTSIQFGRITDVRIIEVDSRSAQNTGALVGGVLGATSGSSGRSSSNRALRGVGGAAVGQRVGGAMGRSQALEYTVLIGGTSTVRIRTEQVGLRTGDCVAVERGSSNNIRLVDDANCVTGAAVPAAAVQSANACMQAKDQLLAAETDEAFDLAERRVRLLCGD
jgi:outer membrane lipoprotein SlyB